MPTDYDDEFEYHDRHEWPVWAAGAAALAVAAALLWFGIGAIRSGGGDDVASPNAASGPTVTSAVPGADGVVTSDAATPSSTQVPSASAETVVPPATELVVEAPDGPPTYPTLADGSPVPVLAIFDDEIIALSGVVPSDSAAERLRIIAIANNTNPGAQVASFLTVNPDVPVDVGVRVIDVGAARFDEDSTAISVEYVAELDRIAAMMMSLPEVTVEVIGHADQRDDGVDNVELSVERARGSVDYLVTQGIDRSRLSFRGVGEADLLTLNNDEVALALNRRTEFVFSGLFVGASAQG